ncbi:MAG: 2OG-Fe(II) oxygenase [Burkholderiaceae bacterium]
MQTLDKAWQNWINENVARGCAYEAMLADMLKAGIAKDVAVFNLNNRSNATSVADQGVSNQQGGPYEQEASYLFQHDNTIITQDGQQIQVAMRVTKPDVVLLDNFMTHDECDAFCELSKSTLTKSTVVDDATGAHVGHEHRTSMGTYFTLGQNDLVKKIEARIAEITGTPVPNGEGIQILNYAGGGEYRPHFDYFPDNTGGRVHTAKGGQRTITVIMYLNDVKAGGATVLPDINLSVYPKKGSALYFSYVNSKGQVDPSTLHGGSPVVDGEKWIATKWIREKVYA